jgi:hyperosmotically inducible periplasmic protein
MNHIYTLTRIGCAMIVASIPTLAQEHKWAGRNLNDLEWRIQEELSTLPSHGVFDDLHFELNGKSVTLSGYTVRDTVKGYAERAVKKIPGVDAVNNQIEVLPASKADDAIRMRVYRAIYESRLLEKYGTRGSPSIHIIVKGGVVTLEGVVDSEADRMAAYYQASKVARPVTTKLRVAPEE